MGLQRPREGRTRLPHPLPLWASVPGLRSVPQPIQRRAELRRSHKGDRMNSVSIIGRLTRDPEQVATKGGTEMTTFSIAVDGRKDEVNFFDCKTAELVAKYKAKGEQVGVTGRLVQERWEKDGMKRSAVRIIAEQ